MGYHVVHADELSFEERQVRNEGDEELVLFIYGAPPEQAGTDFLDDPGPL